MRVHYRYAMEEDVCRLESPYEIDALAYILDMRLLVQLESYQ